ncbi:MAG: hypothetical protein JWP46_2349 [Modestobacter sp.]|nr:hypothetical protein [Modestobacter sp.]
MCSDERTVLMPILARGGHSHPRYGACLTEVAAVLTTHRWTDHPGCVPRLLGRVARRVNDLTSPEPERGWPPSFRGPSATPRPSAA